MQPGNDPQAQQRAQQATQEHRPPLAPIAAAAMAAAAGSSTDATIFDLSDVSASPEKFGYGKRMKTPSPRRGSLGTMVSHRRTTRSASPSMMTTLSTNKRSGRSPARRSIFPSPSGAAHHRVPLDPSADATRAINILVEQLEADRVHMLVLKTAVETLHERTEAQARILEAQDQRMNEQSAVNHKAFQEFAELRGDFTQHKVIADTAHQTIMQALNGPEVGSMIATTVEAKMVQVNNDLLKVMEVVEEHERRKKEMSTYLESLAGERPTEGKFIVSKFEQIDAKFLELGEGISNVRTANIMNATSEQAEHDELKTKVSVLAGAYEAMLENGSLNNFQLLQSRSTRKT